jgi:AcrR family transcriptional regulator
MPRDRFATRAIILESAATIIATEGVAGIGVNSLAEAARCDKVLIYRYFGGLDGVLSALGAERMVWPRVRLGEDGSEGDESLAEAVETLLLEEWAALSGGTLMLASAGAELVEGGASLGAATSMQREELHGRMIVALREKHRIPPYVDLPALLELLSAALTLFALRVAHAPGEGRAGSRAAPTPAFDPATPEGWRRVEKMLAAVTRALLDDSGR